MTSHALPQPPPRATCGDGVFADDGDAIGGVDTAAVVNRHTSSIALDHHRIHRSADPGLQMADGHQRGVPALLQPLRIALGNAQ